MVEIFSVQLDYQVLKKNFTCYQSCHMLYHDSKRLKGDWAKYINQHSKEEKELTKEMREKRVKGFQREVTQKNTE